MKRGLRSYFLLFSFLTAAGAVFYSCNKEEPIPAYIHIDQINVTADYPTQGTASHNIVDAWVYVDGKLIGAFELPVTFPVIAGEGSHSLKIQGGIKIDGISALRTAYPFYDFYNATVTLTPGQVTNIGSVSVPYFPAITIPNYIPWYDDFESPGITLNDSLGDVPIQVDTVDEFEGNKALKATFSPADTSLLWQSNSAYLLSAAQNAIFLELNYKCSVPFNVGLRYQPSPNLVSTFLTLNPTSGAWKKVYINLTDKFSVSSGLPGTGYYHIYFSKLNLDGAANGGSVQIDNIKLLKN
ncbi:MAG: hypothetical protein AB1458_14250 [Bacteroidota bacterium]